MCQGLNSHYFHIIGDGHQPNSRGLYTHYKDSVIKGGRSPIPKKTRLLTMAHVGDYFIRHEIRIPINQPVFHGSCQLYRVFFHCTKMPRFRWSHTSAVTYYWRSHLSRSSLRVAFKFFGFFSGEFQPSKFHSSPPEKKRCLEDVGFLSSFWDGNGDL